MKKLLGLLLNCFALCLCSAIGIGAGMYWMQNTQQKSASPQIQQTASFETSSAPNLLRVPQASQSGEVTPIPTAAASQSGSIQPVAIKVPSTDGNLTETHISLLVNDLPVGSLNPDDQNGEPVPAGTTFFLTHDELAQTSFKVIATQIINNIDEVPQNSNQTQTPKNIKIANDKKSATWDLSDPQFKDNSRTAKFILSLADGTQKQFTFNLKKHLYFETIKIQQPNGKPIHLYADNKKVLTNITLNGPTEQVDVKVAGTGNNSYSIRLLKNPDTNLQVEKTESGTSDGTQQLNIDGVGTYKLILSPGNSKEAYADFTFNVEPSDSFFNPTITTITDSSESTEIVYDLNTYLNTLAAYDLRGPKLSCTVKGIAGRKVRLKYRKSGESDFQYFHNAASTDFEDNGVAEFSDISLPLGKYDIQAEDAWFKPNDPKAISEAKTVIVPDQTNTLIQKPTITAYQNQSYGSKLPLTSSSSPVNVFGNYLELFGSNVTADNKPEFLIFNKIENPDDTNDVKLVPAQPVTKVDPTWKSYDPWHALLKITEGTGKKVLYLRTQKAGNYALSQGFIIEMHSTNLSSPLTIPASLNIAGQEPTTPGIYNINQTQFSFEFPSPPTGESTEIQALFYTLNSPEPIAHCTFTAGQKATLLKPLENGTHQIYMKLAQGNVISPVKSNQITVNIQSTPLKVKTVEPKEFGSKSNPPVIQNLTITFPESNPLNIPAKESIESYKKFVGSFYLLPQNSEGSFLFGKKIYATLEDPDQELSRKITYIPNKNALVLTFENLPTNNYQLVIEGQHVVDKFGNQLTGVEGGEPGSTYRKVLSESKSSSTPPVETPAPETPKEETPSVPAQLELGEFVKYHEYEKRPSESGFNPSDKVVTRVARLYYYRDAHRVAQILNSEVQSMNHTGYHEAQIKAQQTRKAYEGAVLDRQKQEQKAIAAAKELRNIENQYRKQQQTVSALIRRRARLESETATDERPPTTINAEKASLEDQITQAQGVLSDLRADITTKSTTMNTADQSLKELEFKESQLSANLFRDEVKAEKTDLYSIAKGVPCSYDAVQQVTIKVIGEGLIHLRGPIKGVNIVRTMINQIDSPVGQVRIAMHTIQINGEDGKRMEIVADSIQKSIDQSRFLTVQSSQMLRKAIVAVASEVAISSCQDGIGYTQEQRDEKYLYAFFGQDFIEALREMDSEFLQSGNKLLSIHSMDTTSLASALFVLALAKNEIRQQILARFYASLETELPEDELQFLYQGGPTKANKPKHVHLLAPYAHFQSFKGFFDHEVIGTDTMTPIQREFVRLAQIFKARLTTERELNLHVMERAVIEQRGDDYEVELAAAKQREAQAQCKLAEVQKSLEQSQLSVVKATTSLQAQFRVLAEQNQKTAEITKVTVQPLYTLIETSLIGLAKNDPELSGISFNKLTTEQRKEFLLELFPVNNPNLEDFKSNFSKLVQKYFGNTLNETQRKRLLDTYRTFSINLQGQNFEFNLQDKAEGDSTNFQPELVNPEGQEKKDLNKIVEGYLPKIDELEDFYSVFQLSGNLSSKFELIDQYKTWIKETDENDLIKLQRIAVILILLEEIGNEANKEAKSILEGLRKVSVSLQITELDPKEIQETFTLWKQARTQALNFLKPETKQHAEMLKIVSSVDAAFDSLLETSLRFKFAQQNALDSRLALDHRKFLDMNIDQTEDRLIELIEGTRAHTANIDNYLKRIATALEDDFNTQFYYPAFKEARDASRYWNVSFGSMETSTILTNNRSLGKVAPKATIEFDLPKRQLAIIEGMNIADAAFQEYGALVNDPTFLAISSMNGGKRVAGGYATESDTIEKQVLGQSDSRDFKFGSAFENLIPDPAIFKFETGTGFTVRPVIQPDGQAVVFDLNYLYRTNIREPVRPDEKHLGRVKEHFINTDVQLGNYELREVSRFMIALKASRTANGVPLLADVPGVGVLFRPTPSSESSLQQSQIMSQAVIFPTLFDLMGLRWAPAVADVGPLQLSNREFISKGRDRFLKNRVYDYAGSQSERRSDLYRTQQTIPDVHPNGYMGQGLNMKRSQLQENFHPEQQNPAERFIPESNMQERIDTNRAIPVLPNVPQLPSVPPAAEGPTSSTRPIRDSGLKPASWSPTSEASKSGNQDHKGGSWISSPRRITKPQNQQTQTQSVKPAPIRQAAPVPRNIQPAKPESPGFYKRSVSRFKSLFNDD